MKRREFITLLGGAATTWPRAVGAQQTGRMHRIGVLMLQSADDPFGQAYLQAFVHALESLGWTIGSNVEIDARWAAADVDLLRRHAAELVAAAPDVILASTNQPLTPLRQATRVVPIVFVARSAPATSRAWHDLGATPPAFCCMSTASAVSGWNSSN